MHSFEGPLYTTFIHHGDLSGTIEIQSVDPRTAPIHVPWEDIQAFYLEQKRRQLITKLESMTYTELEKVNL